MTMDIRLASSNLIILLVVQLFVSGINGSRQVIKDEDAMINDHNVLKLHSMDDHQQISSHMDHIDPRLRLFFLLEDLKVGNRMALYFLEDTYSAPPWLSREEADTIPFSVKEFPNILKHFSLSIDSPQAAAVYDAVTACESKPLEGEIKSCPTSYEAMVDYVQSIIGGGSATKITALSTSHVTNQISNRLVNYTILGINEVKAPLSMPCHSLPYPYLIFYCHTLGLEGKNRLFQVSLEAVENGETVEAVAICHIDTSHFPSSHPSIRILGIKPGTMPVCHFVSADNQFVWFPSPNN